MGHRLVAAASGAVMSGPGRWRGQRARRASHPGDRRATSSTPDGRPAPARRAQRVAAIAVTRVDRA